MQLHLPDQSLMTQATQLTRQGRLDEATALIQRALGAPSTEPSSTEPPFTTSQHDAAVPTARALPAADRPEPAHQAPPSAAPRRPRLEKLTGLLSTLRDHLPGGPVSPGSLPSINLPSGPLLQGALSAAPDSMLPRVHTSPYGERPYLLHVPESVGDEPVPLVVMLHGGTQDGAAFAVATGMNAFAEEHGFLVAYPEQVTSANAMRYWNWFAPADQRRGSGEAALLADLVSGIAREHRIDDARVYVAGFSAGAAMAAVLGDQYPDVFAAVGVHSGLASGAAHDVGSAFAAMRQAPPTRPSTGGARAIVFHGDADPTVAVANAAAVTAQFCPTPASTVVDRGTGHTRKVLSDKDGRRHELWTVHGSGHAWSGGTPGGSYTDPNGPDASAEMVRFFLGS